MTTSIETMLDELLRIEGGYVNDPADSGGETNYGITIGVARANGYTGPMASMPKDVAKGIYRTIYWLRPNFVAVATFAPQVAAELFDTGVNMGPKVASEFLQRSLNALNRGGSDYPDLTVDGRIGTVATIPALSAFMHLRGPAGEEVLLHALDALQGARYIELAEANPKNERFLYGWLANRIENVHP